MDLGLRLECTDPLLTEAPEVMAWLKACEARLNDQVYNAWLELLSSGVSPLLDMPEVGWWTLDGAFEEGRLVQLTQEEHAKVAEAAEVMCRQIVDHGTDAQLFRLVQVLADLAGDVARQQQYQGEPVPTEYPAELSATQEYRRT